MPAKSPEALERKRLRKKERDWERWRERHPEPSLKPKRGDVRPVSAMSKAELRAMLTAAVINTGGENGSAKFSC